MHEPSDNTILYALFCLSRENLPIDVGHVADIAAVGVVEAGQALLRLERAGLVDAERARLTMLGLARAVRWGGHRHAVRKGPTPAAAGDASRGRPEVSPQPLAALPCSSGPEAGGTASNA